MLQPVAKRSRKEPRKFNRWRDLLPKEKPGEEGVRRSADGVTAEQIAVLSSHYPEFLELRDGDAAPDGWSLDDVGMFADMAFWAQTEEQRSARVGHSYYFMHKETPGFMEHRRRVGREVWHRCNARRRELELCALNHGYGWLIQPSRMRWLRKQQEQDQQAA